MSLNRETFLLIRYSLSPERKSLRVTMTSSWSMGKIRDSLEKVRLTSAKPKGAFWSVPLKMTSSMEEPRSSLTLCSPKTQRMASKTLLLPQPLGPTMAEMPGWNSSTVFWAKDLKPNISKRLKYILSLYNNWDGCQRRFDF